MCVCVCVMMAYKGFC